MDAFCSRDSPAAIEQKYPLDKGQFTWGELRFLARCLGFQDSLFKRYVPEEYRRTEGLPDHILLYLIDLKTFDAGIHRTVNMQSAEYNNKVLRKSVQMLRAREISFPDLRDVQVAFSFYESHDMTGIKAEKQILLQALKLCGRVASPMHLMSEVRRIKDVHLPGSLQLYEFLDLIKICHRTNDEKFATNCGLGVARGNKEMYSMVDFEELFATEDERRLVLLDKEFQLSIFRPQKDPPLLFRKPVQPSSVSGNIRRKMASAAQLAAVPIRSSVQSSNRKVACSRNSPLSRDCCYQSAAVTETDAPNRRSRLTETEDSHIPCDKDGHPPRSSIPVSLWHRHPVVSDKDVDDQRILKETLEWDLILKEQTREDIGFAITNRLPKHAHVRSKTSVLPTV